MRWMGKGLFQMAYEVNTLKKLAAKGTPPDDMDVHDSVIYHTMRYCYRAYKENPTESTKNRLKDFSDRAIELQLRIRAAEEQK